uniref:Vacuolar protein sorting-associated protein 72 homolog n=1 Tax=Strigamia maritima TaxID=126957 RepID=T1JJ51_STRMM
MASVRDRRNNAGARMSRLIEAEEEDDFYKTTYGGFFDEDGDDEYKSEEEESDEVDTDFSIDENDEPVSDQEEVAAKRPRRFISRAYKEPPKKDTAVVRKSKSITTRQAAIADTSVGRKCTRKSTMEKSEETQRRQQERQERQKWKEKKPKLEYQRLTQQELLLEAKITEMKNLKSLESYQRLELEKKKVRTIKQTFKGPIIKFHSVSMPLIEELPPEMLIVDGDSSDEKTETVQDQLVVEKTNLVTKERCCRNFITFSDDQTFKEYFHKVKPKVPQRNMCPITRMPARYFDPVTQMAYANLQAFKVLREAYYQQLEQKGDRKQPDVAVWIDWRKKWKAQQLQTKPTT